MTPKEIVQSAFENYTVGWLECQGFKYSRSKLDFKKKKGDFTQRIEAALDRRNTAQSVSFWTVFSVSSPSYSKWLISRGLPKPVSDDIGCCMDWNILGWSEPQGLPIHFDLSEPTICAEVMESWRVRCEQIGLTYLNQLSTWQGAAKDLSRWRWMYSKAADFFLIDGDKQSALEAINSGIANFTTAGRADQFKELPSLRERFIELGQ